MILRKIDETGLFLEDVIVEEIPMITHEDEEGNLTLVPNPLYIATPCEGGFYMPKWNGDIWVEGLTQQEIDDIKNQPIPVSLEEKVQQLQEASTMAEMDNIVALEGVALVFEENLNLAAENVQLKERLTLAEGDTITALEGMAYMYEELLNKGVL